MPSTSTLGKPAARLDDLLNLFPARLGAAPGIAAPLAGGSAPSAAAIAWGSTAHGEPERGLDHGGDGGRARGDVGETRAIPARRVGPFPGPHTIGQAVRLVQLATCIVVLVAASVALGLAVYD